MVRLNFDRKVSQGSSRQVAGTRIRRLACGSRVRLALGIMCYLCCGSANAALIIDVQDASITAGGLGIIDVLISSNSDDLVDLAQYEFVITNVDAPASTLEFIYPQNVTENQLDNYLFAGDSSGIEVDELASTSSRLIAGDFTVSGNGVTLGDGEMRLLARLDVRHVLAPGQSGASAAGEQFQITLQNSDETVFYDNDPNSDALEIDQRSFESDGVGGGTITVELAAVPEPSSLALMSIAMISAGLMRYTRRKQSRMASGP